MKKKLIILLILLIIIALTFGLVACINLGDDSTDNGGGGSVLDDVEAAITIDTSAGAGGVTRDDIGRIKVVERIGVGNYERFSVSLFMINTNDIPKLERKGKQTIGIFYGGHTLSFEVDIQSTNPKYQVTFVDTGDRQIDAETVNRGAPLSETTRNRPPIKLGYTFGGWYYADNYFTSFDRVVNSNLTLYAKWESQADGLRLSNVALMNNLINNYDDSLTREQIAYANRAKANQVLMPSVGDVKILVIPVWFTGGAELEYDNAYLNNMFFGWGRPADDLCLSEYYYNSSYGKLRITGTVAQPVKLSKTRSQYASGSSTSTNASEVLNEAVSKLVGVNLSDYDNDNNGIVDGIYLVVQGEGRQNDSNEADMYHAYNFMVKGNVISRTKVQKAILLPITYLDKDYVNTKGKNEGKKTSYGTSVLIHETGHYLGLTDYYDYIADNGDDGGLNRLDMMDNNSLDHNPVSKLLLGWITPEFASFGMYDKDIKALVDSATNSAIFIAPKGNKNIFSEFYVVSYMVMKGNNLLTSTKFNQSQVTAERFLVVYHVDLSLKVNGANISFANDNSSSTQRFIRIVKMSGEYAEMNDNATDEDVLTVGEEYNSASAVEYSMYRSTLAIKLSASEMTQDKCAVKLIVDDNIDAPKFKTIEDGADLIIYFDKRIRVKENQKYVVNGEEKSIEIVVRYIRISYYTENNIKVISRYPYIVIKDYVESLEYVLRGAVFDYNGKPAEIRIDKKSA